jgi:hypothetical protein
VRRSTRLLLTLALVPLLSGCFLIAGAQQSSDSTPDGGNISVSFVSADGTEIRSVPTGFMAQPLDVTVSARTNTGQFRIEILGPQDDAVLVLDAQPGEQYKRDTVMTDASGAFRYRIRATGAQNGEFQILYQPGG